MVPDSVDRILEWGLKKKRWPFLLALFGAPVLFSLTRWFLELSPREVLIHPLFVIGSGALLLLSAILSVAVFPRGRRRIRVAIALPLAVAGCLLVARGLWLLVPPSPPQDSLAVGIAEFAPVSGAAEEESKNLAHRLETELTEKSKEGAPISVKRIEEEIRGPDENERKRAAIALGRRQGVHIVLWGDISKDEGELEVEPRLTVANHLRDARLDAPTLGRLTSYGPEHLQFKKRLAKDIIDVVTLTYGLAYYNAADWDRAIQILAYVRSNESYLYEGLSLQGKASQSGHPARELQAAIATFEKILGLPPWKVVSEPDQVSLSAYLNRANAIAMLALSSQPNESTNYLKEAVQAYRNGLAGFGRHESPTSGPRHRTTWAPRSANSECGSAARRG